MFCSRTFSIIFFSTCVYFFLAQLVNTSDPFFKDGEEKLALSGNLYDVFKKRLNKLQKELQLNDMESFSKQIRKKKDDDSRSAANKRLNKYCNELAGSLHSMAQLFGKVHEISSKRSTVRESIYEEYKRRLDKLGPEVFERSGRSHQTDQVNTQNIEQLRIPKTKVFSSNINLKNTINKGKYMPINEDLISRAKYNDMDKSIGKKPGLVAMLKSPMGTSSLFKDTKNVFKRFEEEESTPSEVIKLQKRTFNIGDTAFPDIYNTLPTYPNVWKTPIESATPPTIQILPPTKLLETMAHKMNTSKLELAKQVGKIDDLNVDAENDTSGLGPTLRKYIERTVLTKPNDRQAKQSEPLQNENLNNHELSSIDAPLQPQECDDSSIDGYGEVSNILEKVLSKLERMQQEKAMLNSVPEGAPCNIVGVWNSKQMGIRFDISLGDKSRQLGAAEQRNKLLNIGTNECNPRRKHDIIDASCIFMGSTLKQFGGPFYMYAQKREDNFMAIFAGYCRHCGNIDTIFGTWLFFYPSRDCEDIFTSTQIKRDIFRRHSLEEKRKERFKEILFNKIKRKNNKCKKQITP